jgi:hypothetical protein
VTKATTEKKKPEKSLGKNSFKNFRAHAAPQKLSPWLSYAKALGPWRPKQLTFAVAVAVFTEMVGAALPPSLAPSTRTFSHSASLPSLKQRALLHHHLLLRRNSCRPFATDGTV